MKSRADETLFAAISDDPQTREALADLRPISGATVPLLQEGSINGTLVVLSTERELGEPEFEGILQYADAASHAFALIQARSKRRENGSSHAWTRVSAGDYDIHVYHPRARGAGIFRATPIDANRIGIETSIPGGAGLRATLDIGQGTLSYSADRLSRACSMSRLRPCAGDAAGRRANRGSHHSPESSFSDVNL